MTTDRKELEKAILADPNDDDLRLVFADWLEEHGDLDRASFVRFQCEAARLPTGDRRAQEAEWQAAMLLARYGAEWRRSELPALDGIEWADFERGFVSTVKVRDLAALYRHDAAIAAAAPVYRVELHSLDESELAWSSGAVPWLRAIRLVGAGRHKISETSSILSAVSVIEVVDMRDYDDVGWLLDWLSREAGRKDTPRLTSLKVEGDHTIGLPFVRELVEAGEAAALPITKLDLGTRFVDYDTGYYEDATIGVDGARVLSEATFLRGLRSLSLSRQRIGEAGLRAVVSSFPKLESLEARAIDCTPVDVIGTSAGVPLKRLDLSENPIMDAGASALCWANRASTLEELELDTCEIGPDGLAELTKASFWSTLRRLNLSRNPLGARGVSVLANAMPPPFLHTLGLADVDLDDDAQAVEALAHTAWIRELSSLDLSGNGLGGHAALASLAGGGLRKLSLAKTKLGPEAAVALSAVFRQLWHLDLSKNPLGDEGVAALVDAKELLTLDLRKCGLTSKGLRRFVEGATCRSLYSLKLGYNSFDRVAIRALLESPLMDDLRELDLSSCGLTWEAASAIAKSPRVGRLAVLNLRRNSFDEGVLLMLAHSRHLRDVGAIKLTGSPWNYAEKTRALLVERFGRGWYDVRDTDEIEEGDGEA